MSRISDTDGTVSTENPNKILYKENLENVKAPVPPKPDQQALFQSAQRQRFRLKLGDAIGPLSNPDEIVSTATRLLGQRLGVERVSYATMDESMTTWTIRADYAVAGVPSIAGSYAAQDYSLISAPLQRGENLILHDVSADTRYPAEERDRIVQNLGINAFVSVPVLKEGRLVSSLTAASLTTRTWTEAEIALIEEVAERTWAEVERAGAEAELRASRAWLEGQKEAFQAAVSGAPLESALSVLVRTAVDQIGDGVRCAFYLANRERTELRHVTGMTEPYAMCLDGFKIGADSLACGLAVYTGQPVITPDVTNDPRWKPWLWLANEHGLRACWSFPVETSVGKLLGTLAMYFEQPRHPTRREIDFATVLTNAAAIIISRQQEAEERVRAEKALRESEERQAFLLKLSDASRPLADPLAVQETATRFLGEELGAGRIMYVEVLEADGAREYLVERNYLATPAMAPIIGRFSAADFGHSLVKENQAGHTMVVNDIESEPRLAPSERDAFRALGIKAYITTPLIKEGKWVASIAVHHLNPRAWTQPEILLVEEVAERTWAAAERAKAEAALRESEDKYRTLFETIDEGFCVIEVLFDDDGRPVDYRFLEANPAFERQTGLVGSLGRTMREFAPAHEGHWFEIYGRVARTGEPTRFEAPAEALGRWYDVYAFRVGEPDDYRVAVLFNNITKRKRAELNTQLLVKLDAELNQLTTPTEIEQTVSDRVAEFLHVSRCYFAHIKGGRATTQHEFRAENISESFIAEHLLKDYISTEHLELFARGEALVVDDVLEDPRTSPFAANFDRIQMRALVSTPGLIGGDWFGIFVVGSEVPRVWREDEIKLLRDVAARVYPLLERARTEQALRESETRLQHAISIETVGVIFLNADGAFIDSNDAFLDMTGLTRDEIESGKLCWDDLTPKEWMERSKEALAELEAKGRTTPYEKEYLRKDGTRFWGLFAAAKIDDKVVEYVVDVTERRKAEEALRKSEERLRLLIESAEDYAIFTMTPDNRINYWNAGAERIFGYMEEEILGQSGAILFTPEDRERGVPEDEIRTATIEGRASDERWHISKNGTRFYCSGVMTPLRSGEALRGFAKIARDLTAQKRAEEELRRAHNELEERVRERTAELVELNQTLRMEINERTVAEERARRFMRQVVTAQEDERRNVARDLHDHLGQQLTGLRLKLQNHKEACGDNDKIRREVEKIQAIAERIDEDVDFLAWELRPASLDDFGLPIALHNFVQEWSKHFHISAEFQTTGLGASRLPAEVEINLYRIAQEAMNNISKHAEAGGVDVLLERRDSHVVLIIEDDGKGFDPEMMDTKADGKKAGLLNMRERASFVGGTVDIESQPGEGTTVFVRIPVSSREPIHALKREASHGDD